MCVCANLVLLLLGDATKPGETVMNNDNNSNDIDNGKLRILHLTAPQTVSNTYAQVAGAQSCANHMQHIRYLSHATHQVLITCNTSGTYHMQRIGY